MTYNANYFKNTSRTGYRFTSGSKFFYYYRIIRILQKYKKTGNHIDVGCGEGYFVNFASNYYYSEGIDISEDAINFARKKFNLKFNCNTLDELENIYVKDSFDIISAIDVLEHIQDPNKILNNIYRLLKPEGILLISVPNTHSFGRKIKKRKWFAFRDKTHVSLLEPDTWFNFLESNGFSIELKKTDGLWDSPYLPWIPRIMQHIFFKLTYNISIFLGFLPSNSGENLLLIAKKT